MIPEPLRLWWGQRVPKEKSLLKIAALSIAAALLWALALAPPLRTLRDYEDSSMKLDATLQAMQSLQTQALALQALPRLPLATATQALRDSVQKTFGKNADIAISNANALVSLRGVSADLLAQWLASARTEAHSAPIEAHLTNGPTGWSGTLQMALPTN